MRAVPDAQRDAHRAKVDIERLVRRGRGLMRLTIRTCHK